MAKRAGRIYAIPFFRYISKKIYLYSSWHIAGSLTLLRLQQAPACRHRTDKAINNIKIGEISLLTHAAVQAIKLGAALRKIQPREK